MDTALSLCLDADLDLCLANLILVDDLSKAHNLVSNRVDRIRKARVSWEYSISFSCLFPSSPVRLSLT